MSPITGRPLSTFSPVQTVENTAPIDISRMSKREMIQALEKPDTPLAQRAQILLAIAKAGEEGNRKAIEAQIDILTSSKLRKIARECAEHLITVAGQIDSSFEILEISQSKLLKFPKYILSFGVSDQNLRNYISCTIDSACMYVSQLMRQVEHYSNSYVEQYNNWINTLNENLLLLNQNRNTILETIANTENKTIEEVKSLLAEGSLTQCVFYNTYNQINIDIDNTEDRLRSTQDNFTNTVANLKRNMTMHSRLLNGYNNIKQLLQDRNGKIMLAELRQSIGVYENVLGNNILQVQPENHSDDEKKDG